MIRFLQPPPEDSDRHEHRTRIEQDEAFCEAMARAVKQKRESPPMLGIDTRPGTRDPRTIMRR